MRLYPKRGDVTAVNSPQGRFECLDDGGFELPEPLASHLHSTPDWETAVERERRKLADDLERKRDPASALDEIAGLRADLAAALAALARVQDGEKPARRRGAAKDGGE